MLDIEKERIKNYVKDMSNEERDYLLSQLSSQAMYEELNRRDRLKRKQLSAMRLILEAK